MNPDDMEKILRKFLNTYDLDATTDLVMNEDKYKIKFNTVQDTKKGPIDVIIQVFSN